MKEGKAGCGGGVLRWCSQKVCSCTAYGLISLGVRLWAVAMKGVRSTAEAQRVA